MENTNKINVLDHKYKMAEIGISYFNNQKYDEMIKINCSSDAAEALRSVWGNRLEHVEEFIILLLNRANMVLGWSRISTGGLAGTVADPKVIFQIALKANAVSIILAHCHPSGNTNPSESDIRLTSKLKKAGSFLDIPVLDHIILSKEGYCSLGDQGLL